MAKKKEKTPKPEIGKGEPDRADNTNKADDELTAPPEGSQPAPEPVEDNISHDPPSRRRTERPLAPNPARWSGSWRGKASAVAEVAKDSISAAATTASGSLPSSASTPNFAQKLRTVSKSSPTTQLSRDAPTEPAPTKRTSDAEKGATETERKGLSEPSIADEVATVPQEDRPEALKERPLPAAGWGGWWSRAPQAEEKPTDRDPHGPAAADAVAVDNARGAVEADSKTTAPSEAEQAPLSSQHTSTGIQGGSDLDPHAQTPDEGQRASTDSKQAQTASWFGLWRYSTDEPGTEPNQKGVLPEPAASNVASDGYSSLVTDAQSDPLGVDVAGNDTAIEEDQPPTSGTWAFWSREPPKGSKHKTTRSKSQSGELAIAKTTSESKPQAARMSEPVATKSGTSTPAEQKPSADTDNSVAAEAKSDAKPEGKTSRKKKFEPSLADSILKTSVPAMAEDSGKSGDDDDKSLRSDVKKQLPKNLILPRLKDTLPYEEATTYTQSLWKMLSREPAKQLEHLTLTNQPPKVKKAVAIGVHGYFPTPLIQKFLGQPTGTSLKFANSAAASISAWTSKHQPSTPCSIEKIALEGEGMIASRVETLWKLLLNFTQHLRTADFILIASHSQGVPVSVMLLARLLQFGVLAPHVRLAVCGMAGINLGPFPSYQSRILGTGSANELFDFSRPESTVSTEYATALKSCLQHGARITFVGSIDDQLVSLESSLHVTVSHPYIYRAIFVDGRIHAPGFVTALVSLAAKLRNLGAGDHGLLRELSVPLAGSLYTGEGHSRIYEDNAVYALAVDFAMSTQPKTPHLPSARLQSWTGQTLTQEPEVQRYEPPSTANANPYLLPWALRGILSEDLVKERLKGEVDELRRLFDKWKPQTKQLKDVKVRLEGLKARL